MIKGFIFCVSVFLLCSCSHISWFEKRDSFLWLEEVEGEKALSWVKEQNRKTLGKLAQGKRFKNTETSALEIFQAKDKIPRISIRGRYVYNFWQDDKFVRGLWRRASIKSYKRKNPKWETLLDIDALAKKEKENWVYDGTQCLPPEWRRCLISLSRGGLDAAVVREFDTVKKIFVKDGFYLPEAKSFVSWFDPDHILVGTNFGEGSLTDSGYPRQTKLWKRGTDIKQAKLIFEGKKTDVLVKSYTLTNLKDQVTVISRWDSFFTRSSWLYENGSLKKLPLQKTSRILNLFQGFLIVSLKKDWSVEGQIFPQGSVVAVDKKVAGSKTISKDHVQLLYTPNTQSTLEHVFVTKNKLLISTLENVKEKAFLATFSKAFPTNKSPSTNISRLLK